MFERLMNLDVELRCLKTKAFVAKEELKDKILYPDKKYADVIDDEEDVEEELLEELDDYESKYGASPIGLKLIASENNASVLEGISISKLEFSVRTYNVLKRAEINTLNDLATRTVSDLVRVENMNKKSLEEILVKMEVLMDLLKESK